MRLRDGACRPRCRIGNVEHLHARRTRGRTPRARAAATRALELAQDVAGAHTVLAEVHCYFDGDWEGAMAEHRRALALQPESADVRHSLAWFYVVTGELDHALAETGLALHLDPSSLTIAANQAVIFSYLGRHVDALEQLANVLQLAPSSRSLVFLRLRALRRR